MTSRASLIRVLLRLQRRAQRNASVEFTRGLSRWTERLYAVPKDVSRQVIPRGELAYEWLAPQQVRSRTVLFHIHGGGFVLPLYNPIRYTTGCLARLAGTRALLIEYRLAPEHPFPAALEDCVEAYRWLIHETGTQPRDVVFTGESAGGNLVLTTLLALRDAGEPLPAAGVAICPVFDFDFDGGFLTQDDPMSDPVFVKRQLELYRGDADRRNPRLAPVHADLRGLPPLLIQVGGDELFVDDAQALAECARQAGVDVTLHVYPGMWHFWHMYAPRLPEARQAMDEIAAFVRKDF